MSSNENIKNSNELKSVIFCIENIAHELGVNGEQVYLALTEKSDIFHENAR